MHYNTRKTWNCLTYWTCVIQGLAHDRIFMEKLRFSSHPREKVKPQRAPGTARAQPFSDSQRFIVVWGDAHCFGTKHFVGYCLFSRRRQQFGGQGRSGGRGGRGRGRGRGGRRGGFQRANVTAEDLDAELDAYHDAVKIITPPPPFKIQNYVDAKTFFNGILRESYFKLKPTVFLKTKNMDIIFLFLLCYDFPSIDLKHMSCIFLTHWR